MATTKITMNALGIDAEKCAGCLRNFLRGERMNAMEYDDGDSAGWHCDECVETWKTKGEAQLPRWTWTEDAYNNA